jgi:nitrate/nitrite transporter NarK
VGCRRSREFFIRIHGWNRRQTGAVLGTIVLTTGCVGIYVGGWVCDRWQKQGIREAPLKVACITGVGGVIPGSLAMVVPASSWTVGLLVPTFFFAALPVGSSYASIQLIFPNQVRGQISAVFLFAVSLLGQSLGATASRPV